MGPGVVYVAYGRAARLEAGFSIESLRMHHRWPVHVVGDGDVRGAKVDVVEPEDGTPGRWAKVHLDKLTPYDDTLFLDADTRVRGDLEMGFRALENGWDFVMVSSLPQGTDVLNHLSEEERGETLWELPLDPYQLNTGVMWFRKTTRVKRFFAAWRDEWRRWRGPDQGAFLRALERRPMAVYLLGRPYNGGAVVEHRFGACRVR